MTDDRKIFLVRCKREEIINRPTIEFVEITLALEEKMSASLTEENPTLKRITQGFIDKTFPYQKDDEIMEGLVRRENLFDFAVRIAKAINKETIQKLKEEIL